MPAAPGLPLSPASIDFSGEIVVSAKAAETN
jgi:hypothetical protein